MYRVNEFLWIILEICFISLAMNRIYAVTFRHQYLLIYWRFNSWDALNCYNLFILWWRL